MLFYEPRKSVNCFRLRQFASNFPFKLSVSHLHVQNDGNCRYFFRKLNRSVQKWLPSLSMWCNNRLLRKRGIHQLYILLTISLHRYEKKLHDTWQFAGFPYLTAISRSCQPMVFRFYYYGVGSLHSPHTSQRFTDSPLGIFRVGIRLYYTW